MTALYVALGAALGAPLRFLVGRRLDRPDGLPWGTIAVNVGGSLLLGVLTGLGLSGDTLALLGVGFCGGLTTYSAFAVQTAGQGLRRGVATVLLTVPPALAACALGHVLGAAAAG